MHNKPTQTWGYVGWRLPLQEKLRLLKIFPPKFSRVIAHHVTLFHGVSDSHELPLDHVGVIIGESTDAQGVQALVVQINGTHDRPGGGVFHVTWSLAPGRKPVESNQVIAQHGWHHVNPELVQLIPEFFPFKTS